jgi:DNA-binding CsgD family transcriptional regulator
LLGRDDELRWLQERFEQPTTSVFVEGAAGIGKSALLEELIDCARQRQVASALVRFRDSGPVVSVVRVFDVLEEVRGQLPGVEIRAKADSPLTVLPADGEDGRSELFIELTRRFTRLLTARPVVVVFDDVHQADPEGLQFLEYLASQRLENLHLFVASRSDWEPARLSPTMEALRRQCEVLRLRGLSVANTRSLFALTATPVREDEAAHLHSFTRGNPLFITELASQLAGSILLESLSLREALSRLQIPRSLAAVVDRLLEATPPDVIEVLEVAACVGARFDSAVVDEVYKGGPETVEDALNEAWEDGLLKKVGGPTSSEFEFDHPLLKERLLRRTPSRRRRAIHHALARLGEEVAETFDTEELALHAARGFYGADATRAIGYCRAAAEEAERLCAFEVAVEFWALAVSKARVRQVVERADIYFRLALAYRKSGNWIQATESMLRARVLFLRLDDRHRAVEAALFIAEMARFRLQLDECIRWCEVGIAAAESFPDLRLRGKTLLGSAMIVHNELAAGLVVLRQAMEEAGAPDELPADIAYWTAHGLTSAGEIEEARMLLEAGLRSAIRSQDRTYISLIAGGLTFAALHLLDLNKAEECVALLNQMSGPKDIIAVVRSHYANAMLEAYKGNWQRVAEIASQWRTDVRLASRFQQATAELILAEALSILGHHAEALAVADGAIPLLEQQQTLASLHSARMLLREGEAGPAAELLSSVGDRIATRPHGLGTRPVLGDLAGDVGSTELARKLLLPLSEEPRAIVIVYAPVSVRRVLGKLHARLGDFTRAFACFDAAILDLTRGGACYELALTYLDYARARRSRGRRGDEERANALQREGELHLRKLALPTPPSEQSPAIKGGTGNKYGLTSREREVLALVVEGKSNREIALMLRVKLFTAARHMESILRKTGTANRTEVTRLALAEWLVERET